MITYEVRKGPLNALPPIADSAELGIMPLLHAALLACALALADASELGSSRQRLLSRDERKRRLPPMAFQLTDVTYEADQEKLKAMERDRNDLPTPLMMFYGRGDDYCAQMEPLLQRLQKEEGLTVRKFEVWHTTRNTELLRKLDPARCGGVPFFYNKESHRWICGATTYDNLKAWGSGTACDPFAPPPMTDKDKDPDPDPEEPEGGFGLFVSNLKKKAQEKMAERNAEKGDGDAADAKKK